MIWEQSLLNFGGIHGEKRQAYLTFKRMLTERLDGVITSATIHSAKELSISILRSMERVGVVSNWEVDVDLDNYKINVLMSVPGGNPLLDPGIVSTEVTIYE